MFSRFPVALFSIATLLASSLPAAALEPKAVADALVAAMASNQKLRVAYGEAVQQGSDVLIHGLSISRQHETGGEAVAPAVGAAAPAGDIKAGRSELTFAETLVENPADSGAGVFTTPRITFTAGTTVGQPEGRVGNASLTGVTVFEPGEVNGNQLATAVQFRTAEASGIEMKPDTKFPPVTVARVFVEADNYVENVAQKTRGVVEKITVPNAMYAGRPLGPQTFGYGDLVFNVAFDGERDPAADTIELRDLTIGLQDGGDLKLSGVVAKFPAGSETDPEKYATDVMKAELHTATLRYDDKSLAGRVLDYFAKQQGIAAADYANGLVAALPFLLATVNNPQFQDELSAAIGSFLRDPRSLTVKLEPAAPVSGEEIMNTVKSALQTLPDRLNVSVTANGS